jgi:hypothetical protein
MTIARSFWGRGGARRRGLARGRGYSRPTGGGRRAARAAAAVALTAARKPDAATAAARRSARATSAATSRVLAPLITRRVLAHVCVLLCSCSSDPSRRRMDAASRVSAVLRMGCGPRLTWGGRPRRGERKQKRRRVRWR